MFVCDICGKEASDIPIDCDMPFEAYPLADGSIYFYGRSVRICRRCFERATTSIIDTIKSINPDNPMLHTSDGKDAAKRAETTRKNPCDIYGKD